MYSVKRFSSLTKESKTQRKARRDLAKSAGMITGLTGIGGTIAYDASKSNQAKGKLLYKIGKARYEDGEMYENIKNKIRSVSNDLMSKAKTEADQYNILKAEALSHSKNNAEFGRRLQATDKMAKKGGKLINKASNKRLAIGLGLSTAAGLGAAYGVSEAIKKRNSKLNDKRFSGKFARSVSDVIEDMAEVGIDKYESPTKINKMREAKTQVIKWVKKNPKAATGAALGTAAALGTGATIYTLNRKKKKK